MTCIVGFAENGKVFIGGDSAGVGGLNIRTREDPKVFKNENMIIGCTSSFRMINLLKYKLKIPKQYPGMDDYEYLCTDFIDAVIKCFKDFGYAKIDNNSVSGGVFILGYNKNLYYVDSDFQVGINKDNYDSCGCGESYALGALKTMDGTKMPPNKRIEKALDAACYFSAGVRGPYNIVNL